DGFWPPAHLIDLPSGVVRTTAAGARTGIVEQPVATSPPTVDTTTVDTTTVGSSSPSRRATGASLVTVALVALGLNTWRLSLNGLGDQYYAAATRAMASSWHNWFFVALDRGGFISVDKPPVPLWISALSARLFGLSSWSILLPTALAGTAAVAVLWLVVRRAFGLVAATLAALVLAVSPVNVAVDRLNLPEAWLVLFLLAAVWAVQRALASTRAIRWLVLAGGFVGLAFNTKMLAAYLVVPGLGMAVVLGARTWRERIGHGAVFGAAALLTSLPWILVVDAVPATSRPYVGGSTDNTVLDLIFGYNGLGRVEGNGGFVPGGPTSSAGGVFGGRPGPLRLLGDALGGQIGWLLPIALAGLVAALWLHRRQRVQLAVLVMWSLWLVVVGYVFSDAQGTFHAYYTALLGPPVAALVGIGVASFVPLVRRERRWGYAVIAGVAATVALQLELSGRQPGFYAWTRWVVVPVVMAAAVWLLLAILRRARTATITAAAALGLAALLLTPAAWAGSESANAVLNATLPQAGPRQGVAGLTFGATSSNGDAELAAWLLAHAGSSRWQLVMASAQGSSGMMADQGLSIISLGGFMGTDPAATLGSVARMIAAGEVRYFFVDGIVQGPRGTEGPQAILAQARRSCTAVTDLGLPVRYRGQIYDCAGKAAAFT
ncbi:MAG: glycosyl transferase family 39, partial [Ilumatobacteraceae bacterium]|nr:glycosyl transferase family 39 [Ilumatobacteraceae bacterium]